MGVRTGPSAAAAAAHAGIAIGVRRRQAARRRPSAAHRVAVLCGCGGGIGGGICGICGICVCGGGLWMFISAIVMASR